MRTPEVYTSSKCTRLFRALNGYSYYSVIVLPSLGSYPIGSWNSPRSNDVWLRDYLPEDVPNIRVLLYGYDTSSLNNESKASVEGLGRRFLESFKAFRADIICAIQKF